MFQFFQQRVNKGYIFVEQRLADLQSKTNRFFGELELSEDGNRKVKMRDEVRRLNIPVHGNIRNAYQVVALNQSI